MQKIKRLAILLFVLFASVGCDQATKALAQRHLSASPPLLFLNGIFRLQYAENPGAFLSFGAGFGESTQRWIFTGLVALILGGVLIFILRETRRSPLLILVALALFLSGGIGNLLDRVYNHGRVIDFMNIGIGGVRTGIFNVADMALMSGMLIILLASLRQNRQTASE
jgi:signal peptidase II